MALALSEEQLVKLNKKDVLQLLLESMAQEKELRSQLAVLTDELKRTNQQMQVILEKWNLAQANRLDVLLKRWGMILEPVSSWNLPLCTQNALMKQKPL